MILNTRFRDVPWEEIAAAHGQTPLDHPEWWEQLRDTPVDIHLPPIAQAGPACNQPHYYVAGEHRFMKTQSRVVVCPHLVEIGD